MSFNYWANMVWGINMSDIFTQQELPFDELYDVIDTQEGGANYYPVSFMDNNGDLKPKYKFLDEPNVGSNRAVMKLWGEQIARKLPYIYDLLKAGAHFHIVPSEANEYAGSILLGWGMVQLPIKEGTTHLPAVFLDIANHWSWVNGG